MAQTKLMVSLEEIINNWIIAIVYFKPFPLIGITVLNLVISHLAYLNGEN